MMAEAENGVAFHEKQALMKVRFKFLGLAKVPELKTGCNWNLGAH